MKKVTFVKDIRILKDEPESEVLAVKATGVAALKNLYSPGLIQSDKQNGPSEDGIYELDFVLEPTGTDPIDVELEVDVVFRIKKIPDWVKGIRVNAQENSDIELI